MYTYLSRYPGKFSLAIAPRFLSTFSWRERVAISGIGLFLISRMSFLSPNQTVKELKKT